MREIPLRGGVQYAHQTFSVNLGGQTLDFELHYITNAGPAWTLNVSRSGERIISGAMLNPGAEISAGYNADAGRFFFVGEEVTLDNLGSDNHLVWVAE